MRKFHLSVLLLGVLAAPFLAGGQSTQNHRGNGAITQTDKAHVIVTPDKLAWGPSPPGLPAGAQVAVLEGDPTKAGSHFALRAKLPDGYRVPPHWHPTDERILVLQGSLGVGTGDKFDQTSGHELPTGSYAVMPMGVRHFVWAKGETIIQVSAAGPFQVNYVNPADDPRKSPK